MVEISEGRITLGEFRRSGRFGWDNEFEAFEAAVRSFEIDRYMVSNGEFLEFVTSGGYRNEKLWAREDWQWRQRSGINHPVFWTRRAGEWFYRGMFEEVPLPLEWPVYVSYAEASAYARWARKVAGRPLSRPTSLPTER